MAFNEYIQSGGKYLRCGYTTGTCAALAAAAAARLLMTGRKPESVSLITPKGIRVEVSPYSCEYVNGYEDIEGNYHHTDGRSEADGEKPPENSDANRICARAAIRKDAGDDKDVTDGLLVCATVIVYPDNQVISPKKNKVLLAEEKSLQTDAEEAAAEETNAEEAAADETNAEETNAEEAAAEEAAAEEAAAEETAAEEENAEEAAAEETNAEATTAEETNAEEAAAEETNAEETVAEETNAEVTKQPSAAARISADNVKITVEGGPGVGRVTKPGLDQPVGCAAINHVPRRMIERAVRDVCEIAGFFGRVSVVISVPEGEKIAGKTFNKHLGIEGGISILGTSGIVEPMSMQAFIDAVCVEIRQVRHMNESGRLILTPGNYGMDFLKNEKIPIADIPIVMCSNFIGDALDAAAAENFREVLIAGHIGKLVKLAGGIMNTHSRYADCRMELFAAHAAICGARSSVCRTIMDCVTTDACLDILKAEGIQDEVMRALMASIEKYLVRRVGDAYTVGALTFSNVQGLLGLTEGAEKLLSEWQCGKCD